MITSAFRIASSASGNVGDITMSPRSAKTSSKSSDRQVQASENRCRGDADGQRDAAAVEILGDLRGRSAGGAAIDHARQQKHRAGRVGRIADRPGADRQVDGHRRDRARLLGDDDRAIGSTARDGFESGTWNRADVKSEVSAASDVILDSAVFRLRTSGFERPASIGSGSNQPTVRLEGIRTVCATFDTSSSVTAAIRDGASRKLSTLGDRLEVPQLMRDVRDAVVVEHEPRFELRLGFRQFGLGDALAAHAIELLEQHRP